MAIQPVSKTHTRVINEHEARSVQCIKLYDECARQFGTNDIALSIVPGSSMVNGDFIDSGRPIRLLRSSRYIYELLPPGYTEAKLIIDHSYGLQGFNPDETLTLRQFLIRTLDIWESMLPKVSRRTQFSPVNITDAVAEELIIAMEILKNTYMLTEMMDTWVSPDGTEHRIDMVAFKELFNVPAIKQLAASTPDTDSDPTGVK